MPIPDEKETNFPLACEITAIIVEKFYNRGLFERWGFVRRLIIQSVTSFGILFA